MTSNRPYLVRALYEWILDNQMTPHLLVDATCPGVTLPERFVQDGKIVLNIGPVAVRDLVLGNDQVVFSARFGGVSRDVNVPIAAVIGVYARENGHGMLFPEENLLAEAEDGGESAADDATVEPTASGADQTKPKRRPDRPALKIVK